jgi:hypothetical protein
MNAHVSEPFRSIVNRFAGFRKEFDPTEWYGPSLDEAPPELCPCSEDITDVAVRCEGCGGRFCLNCVALCDRYAVCATCAPETERILLEAGDDPESLAAIRRFMGGEQAGREA